MADRQPNTPHLYGPRGDPVARFQKFISPAQSGCWLWTGTGSCTNGDYGTFWLGGRMQRAHRVSWEMNFGPIPTDKVVCHRCDTPRCVNPDHLFLGSQQDNIADMKAKGRAQRVPKPGETNNAAKLTEANVIEIRRLDIEGVTRSAMAERFGLSESQVRRIILRQRWAHVP